MPSRLGSIIGMSVADLEKVIYFAGYIITKVYAQEKERIFKEIEHEFKNKVKNVGDDKTKEALKEMADNCQERNRRALPKEKSLTRSCSTNSRSNTAPLFEAGIGARGIYEY